MSGSKYAALGVIGIILGAGGLGLGLLSTFTLNTVSDDKWYDPYHPYGYDGALETNIGWYAPIGDNDAVFYALFVVPQTRSDWRICIIHQASSSVPPGTDLSGKITAGVSGHGDTFNTSTIFYDINMDLTFPAVDTIYHIFSSTFSASAGDKLYVHWQKDDSPSGSGSVIIDFALVHG